MKKGFSLIELMVVIAIVAVLSAVAIPAYNGYIERAKMSHVHNNIQQQLDLWQTVTNTGNWFTWEVADRYRPVPDDMPYLGSIYVNWANISLSFNPGYFNREATTYVQYIPVLDGTPIDGWSGDASQINRAKIISWTCSVGGIDGAYAGYTVEEFRQAFFPNCS